MKSIRVNGADGMPARVYAIFLSEAGAVMRFLHLDEFLVSLTAAVINWHSVHISNIFILSAGSDNLRNEQDETYFSQDKF